jgi:hypothetical protein
MIVKFFTWVGKKGSNFDKKPEKAIFDMFNFNETFYAIKLWIHQLWLHGEKEEKET